MTDTGDDLTALRDRVPRARSLPRRAAHRAGLMAVLSVEPPVARPQPFRPSRPSMRPWLSPVAAAAAVGAIAVAVTLPHLIGSTTARGTHRLPAHPGHGSTPAGRPGHGSTPAGPPGHGPRRSGLNWQVPISGLHEVVVRTSEGTVTVKAAPTDGVVVVSASRHFSGTAPAISSKVVAGVLEVTGQCPQSDRRCTVSFEVSLPRTLPVRVNDALGTVRLVDLSGPVTVTDALGDIEGVGLTCPRVRLTDDLGNISVAFTSPPAHLVATGQEGNVTVSVPTTTAYQVTAQAMLGTATVSVPTSHSAVHVIRASSQLGNVTVTGSG